MKVPQIGPDIWKVALSYYWWRQYADGRIEQEFDLETGRIMPWDATPAGLKKAGWVPVTVDLARKMQVHGEFGIPTQSPSIMVQLRSGDELEIHKECTVLDGFRIHCKACGAFYRAFGDQDGHCRVCGAKSFYRCPQCDKLADEETCPDCRVQGRMIDPLEKRRDKWEDVVYFLGIKGLFCHKFNSRGLVTEH